MNKTHFSIVYLEQLFNSTRRKIERELGGIWKDPIIFKYYIDANESCLTFDTEIGNRFVEMIIQI